MGSLQMGGGTLAIVGPTASGKSTVAMAVAEAGGGEIVCCDSVQVYRRFEVGCAKPTAAERARVPHHVLDVCDWHEAFDAERYRQLATAAIDEIVTRDGRAILCGGTGLYLRALRWGLVDLPTADPELRQRLETEHTADPGVLYRRLLEVDPESARVIEPNNVVHIIRALEIHALTGEPASVLRAAHGFSQEQVPMRVVALRWSAERLRDRIAERTDALIAAGLVDEVRTLIGAGVDPGCRPMGAVGYREACEVIAGRAAEADLAGAIVRSTVAYARRQRTWLNREKDIEWVEIESLDDLRRLAAELQTR